MKVTFILWERVVQCFQSQSRRKGWEMLLNRSTEKRCVILSIYAQSKRGGVGLLITAWRLLSTHCVLSLRQRAKGTNSAQLVL
jgi:hypothetical protein